MKGMKFKYIIGLVVLLSIAGLALASDPAALTADNIQPPVLPPACQHIQVQPGNEVAFRTYAIGVQVYRWNGMSWDFVAPDANLFADANYRGKVGTHYGGPTWESKSGSLVIGRLVTGCTADPSAVDWLLLERRSSDGPGIFGDVTFIQRVNTVGGLRPVFPGIDVGEEKRVPYTTEYYFYRAAD